MTSTTAEPQPQPPPESSAQAAPSSSSSAPGDAATPPAQPKKSKKPPHPRDPKSQSPRTQLSKALSYLLRHGAEKEKLPIREDGFVPLDEVLRKPRVKTIDMAPESGAFTKDGKKKRAAPCEADVRSLVEDVPQGEKKRFELREERRGRGEGEGDGDGEVQLLVRAMQGHSIASVKELDHVPVTLDTLHVLALQSDTAHVVAEGGAASQADVPADPPALPQGVEILHGTTRDAWDKIRASGGLSRMKRNHVHLARGRPGVQGVGSGMRPTSPLLIHVDLIAALRDGVPFHLAANGALLTPGAPGTEGILPLKYISKVEERVGGKVIWQREGESGSE